MNRQDYEKLGIKQKEIAILAHATLVRKRQRCPYTFIELELKIEEDDFEDVFFRGWGISKVSFPDKWDSDRGENVATQRAVRDIRKQLESDES